MLIYILLQQGGDGAAVRGCSSLSACSRAVHDDLRQRRQARIRRLTRATILHWANLARSARLCADLGVLRDRLVWRATRPCNQVVPVSASPALGQGEVCTRSHCAVVLAPKLALLCWRLSWRCCAAFAALWLQC
jgi:hypothetical protein